MRQGHFRAIDAADLPPLVVPPPPPQTTVVGVAAGALTAPTALCAVRYTEHLRAPGDPLFGEQPVFQTRYTVLGTERLPAGTPYPDVAARVNVLAMRLFNRDSRGAYHVVVDASSVGTPVVDAIRLSIIPQVCVTGVTITPHDAGDLSLLWRRTTTVGKRYLISRLQAILQGQRLTMPQTDLTMTLLDALTTYPLDVIEPVPHDDLCLSLALACGTEYQPVRYGLPTGSLPSARL